MGGEESSHVLFVTDQEDSRDGTLELGDCRHRLRDVSVSVWTRFLVVLFRRLFSRGGSSRGCCPTFLDMGVFWRHAGVEVGGDGREGERYEIEHVQCAWKIDGIRIFGFPEVCGQVPRRRLLPSERRRVTAETC